MSFLLAREPRISSSGLLTVVVERDLENAPDDEEEWTLVSANAGAEIPQYFAAGYLHAPGCTCQSQENISCGLCDVGWLQEFVSCAGVFPLIEGNLTPYIDKSLPLKRLRLTGRMVSERFESMEGTDYDERFEVENAEVIA